MRGIERPIRAVVLAAGSSRRTAPVQKLLAPFRGRTLVDYALAAALPWNPVVIAGAEVAERVRTANLCSIVLNEHPERGMSYSLKLADAAIPPEASLLVFLADKPSVAQQTVERVCATRAQVAFPVHADHGAPGHPVLFDASVRWRVRALPDGDSLHVLRDDPDLRRDAISTLDEGAFFDVDDARWFSA